MIVRRFLAVFFPDRCPYCKKIIHYPMTECEECLSGLYTESRMFSVFGDIPCAAAFPYDDPFRRAVLDMKFKGRKFNSESLGKAITAAVYPFVVRFHPDVVCCVPMSRDRLRVRGYNQSELLARIIAKELEIPFCRLLDRKNGAKIQHELTMEERLANNDLRFFLKEPDVVKGKTILLIDDIITSGMTVSECARILRNAGAEKVICACAAVAGSHEEYKLD